MTDYTDAATVRLFVGLEADDPDPDVEPAVAAANAFASALDHAPVDAGDPAFALGCKLLAARWYKRKFTTEGVGTFGSDIALYIRRTDPDVATLLRLGYPAVG